MSTMSSKALAGETESFVRYGVTDRLELGFGYLWRPKVVRPLASYTFVKETRDHPSLAAGLMFDSLGGGREGVFVSAGKNLNDKFRIPATAYVGGAMVSNEDSPRLIAGVNYFLNRGLTLSAQFDGKYSHLGLIASAGRLGSAPVRLGVVYSKNRYFGPLIAVNFPLKH